MSDNKDDDLLSTPIVSQGGGQQQGVSLEQALQIAAQHQNAGQFQQAENVLRQILKAQPNCAPAYHSLGIIAHQVDKTDVGIDLIGKAIEIDDNQSSYHANRGEMCRILGRLDESITHGERAAALDPKSATAHCNLGIAYFDREDFDKAEASQASALQLMPQFPNALNNMGSLHREKKDPDAAIEYFKKAIAADPAYVEPLNNIGATLIEEERAEDALPYLQKALSLAPDYAEAQCNLACSYRQLDEFDKALTHFATALGLRPIYPEASLGIAGIRLEQQELVQAINVAQQALALSPENAELHTLMGSIQNDLGFPDRSEEAFNKALELDPDSIGAHNGLGTLRLEQGDADAALELFDQAQKIDPEKIETLFNMGLARKFSREDPELAKLQEWADKSEELSDRKRVHMHFALGKALDDLGDYDAAFRHFLEGNRLKRKTFEYSAEESARTFEVVRDTFNADFFAKHNGAGTSSKLPIFVLGLPRSGTTLTEQIIASHPDVFGAGELRELSLISNAVNGPHNPNFPHNMSTAPAAWIKEIGQHYIEQLQAHAPQYTRITDKMPANFLFIGLIHMALPNAKIVHVMRNPVDTGVSTFTRLFGRNQYQSYELGELGRYCAEYQKVMEHWRKVLPEGTVFELQYEQLVEDTEGQTRRLIEYLELPWDDACLDFTRTERQVRTASLTQVRQPIYKSSVERWRKYEKHLEPLIDAIEKW